LSNILQMVKDAQTDKPPVQQLADRISAVFVPLVVGIAILSFCINYFVVATGATTALMRSIAVLVISCPCAMGLATPAAIAVGLGRATGRGILFRNAKSLELFKDIKTVVFDKTGTLTTGVLKVAAYHTSLPDETFKNILSSIEKYSNHPLAKAVVNNWPTAAVLRFNKVEEVKGKGMIAEDAAGNKYTAGSWQLANLANDGHSIYLTKNGDLVGWVDLADTIRPEAKTVIDYLHGKGITTVLLSGDTAAKTQAVAAELGIANVYAQKLPAEKLEIIAALNKKAPVAMVGDGINDAPALAKATIGLSMSDASQVAMQTAQVVMVNNGIARLPEALGLGKHTYLTIKQNLFWAFIYNIIAIPVAAAGYLHPGFAALIMGGSDVVLAINSIWLKYKKVL
jgi:P-type Cu+ transporter